MLSPNLVLVSGGMYSLGWWPNRDRVVLVHCPRDNRTSEVLRASVVVGYVTNAALYWIR